jgi:hypothetical protein
MLIEQVQSDPYHIDSCSFRNKCVPIPLLLLDKSRAIQHLLSHGIQRKHWRERILLAAELQNFVRLGYCNVCLHIGVMRTGEVNTYVANLQPVELRQEVARTMKLENTDVVLGNRWCTKCDSIS